jgi:hypothetical protein
METCIVDGCDRTNGPEDLEVYYKGEPVGFLCSGHIGRSKAMKLIVSRPKTDESFRLTEAIEIPNPLD